LFGPVAGELGEEWADLAHARDDACVAVGWQGMLRQFADNGLVRRIDPVESALLAAAGLVCASVDDMSPGIDLAGLRGFARRAAIVLTAGHRGGLVLRDSSLVRYPAIPGSRVVDPTGAGDVFMAALMAAWLRTGEVATPRDLRYAAAAGSCAVEGMGLAGVPTRAQVAARLRAGAASNQAGPAT
jgi:sugar/nucleoside kinase (ribokinase family)